MYALLKKGAFGNTLRVWTTEEEYLASGYKGLTSLRCLKRGVRFRHALTHEQALIANRQCFEGCSPTNFVYCEAAPEWDLRANMELCQTWNGLELRWATEKVNHRIAMRSAQNCSGLKALEVFKHFTSPEDQEEILCLLDLYPNHTIELATFHCSLGFYQKQYVLWECRLY